MSPQDSQSYNGPDRKVPLGILALVLGAYALIGIGVGYLAFMNAGVTSRKTIVTAVEEKRVNPAHTTWMQIGRVRFMQHHPASYHLQFTIEGNEVGSTVHKEFFDSLDVGDKIEVECEFGKLGNSYKPVRFLKPAH